MTRMLATSSNKWYDGASWRGNPGGRRRARAHESERLRRATREVDPPTEREYWSSLFDDENAPTGEVWRACVENDRNIASLPVGYDGTWCTRT